MTTSNGKKTTRKKYAFPRIISDKRVVILITDSLDGGKPILDHVLYLDQEQRVRDLVESLGPMPRQRKRIDYADASGKSAADQLAQYQQAATKLADFMEDKNTPEALKDALNIAVLDFVNDNYNGHDGAEVARVQLARALQVLGERKEAN
jgi:hypothetical protein